MRNLTKLRVRTACIAISAASLLIIGGCSENFERWNNLPEPKELKVEQVHYTHAVQFAAGDDRLPIAERDRLDSFLAHAQVGSADKVYVNVEPDGAMVTDRRISTVAAFLKLRGLKPASPITGFAEDEKKTDAVNVVVRRHLVTLPGCPDWTSEPTFTFNNTVHSNYGCATASNLGMMIADPEDLINGRTLAPADGDYLRTSIDNYRAGKTKALLDPKGDSGEAEPAAETGDEGS